MRFKTIFAVGLLSVIVINAYSQESDESQADPTAPVVEHVEMAGYTGKWDVQMNFAYDKDNVYAGTATNVMLIGDRFLQIQYSLEKRRYQSRWSICSRV